MTDRTHPDSGIPFTYGNYVSYEEHMQTLHAKIEELEAELAKARKPCLLQISEPEGEYPPLPAPDMETAAGMKYYHQGKLRAYVDADRAMRESARPTETPTCEDASYESLNLAEMVLSDCGHSGNYKPLLERVAGRIDRHVERLLTAQQADRAMRARAAPAPSAAADLIAALEEARSAINSMKVEAETAGQGDEQMMLEACETISNEGLQADIAIRAALASAPQPSPTPQADSQPAEVWDYPPLPDFDTVEQHIYGACRRYITQDMLEPIHNLIRDAIDADRAPQQDDKKPYAYAVYFPDQPTVELVHDLDELTDDLTNREHQITKLYAAPQAAPAAVAVPSDSEIDALVASIGPTEGIRRDSRDLTMDKLRVLVRRALATWGHIKAAPWEQNESAYQRGYMDGMAKGRRDVDAAPQQEAQEPVAWRIDSQVVRGRYITFDEHPGLTYPNAQPLYTAPQPAPVAQADALDAAFDAVRQRLCGLQRYSFVLDDDDIVRRVQDRTGNWIEFDAAHELFNPVAVDAARSQAKEGGA